MIIRLFLQSEGNAVAVKVHLEDGDGNVLVEL